MTDGYIGPWKTIEENINGCDNSDCHCEECTCDPCDCTPENQCKCANT